MATSLGYGPPGPNFVHLCVDMQRLFAPGSPWGMPWIQKVRSNVRTLTQLHAERTIFTRFIPPADMASAMGGWRHYYARWPEMLGDRLPPEQLDLLPELAEFVPPGRIFDKHVYSPWHDGRLGAFLRKSGVDTLLVTGGETDICVLATVLGAIDLGFRTVIVSDGVCSSVDESHDAAMTIYRTRLSQQIETVRLDDLLTGWTPA